MNIFFVIGLPRSRTAWLANFLTNGDALCHHELMRRCSSLDELAGRLNDPRGWFITEEALQEFGDLPPQAVPAGSPASPYRFVGDAGPALVGKLPELLERFPTARYVFVRRHVHEAYESYQRAFPRLNASYTTFLEADKAMSAAVAMLPEDRCLEVIWDLDGYDACNDVHEFCLARPAATERYQMLSELRLTAIAEKAAVSLAPWAKRELIRQSQPQSNVDKAWENLTREICGDNRQAFDWLMDLMGIALTWDHIVDGDSINLLVAERAFEAMLLKWPLNAFWLKHAVILAPVLSNAVAAWRNGERPRHFDCYSEPALAVAYALGGVEHVNRFAARVHELVRKGRVENDSRDTLKRPLPSEQVARAQHQATPDGLDRGINRFWTRR